MRREIKLVLLVVSLVVGPAVVLSFLAGRILGNWQVVLQRRMEVVATKALDDAARAWTRRLDNARLELQESLASRSPVQVFPAYAVSNTWCRGVFVFAQDRGLIYPADEDIHSVLERVRGAGAHRLPLYGVGSANLATNPVALIREYRQWLDQAEASSPLIGRIRLRLAQAYRANGQADEARACLAQLIREGSGHDRRRDAVLCDPEDGFYYDLVALKAFSRMQDAAGTPAEIHAADVEFARRVLDRYDRMAVSQRTLAVSYIDHCVAVSGLDWDAGLLAQWMELKRGLAVDLEQKYRLEQEYLRLQQSGLVSIENWTTTRLGTNEYWFTMCARTNRSSVASDAGFWDGQPENLVLAIEVDRQRLARSVADSVSGVGAVVGIVIHVTGWTPYSGDPGPRLSERRMPPPLDRTVLTAYPADRQAFLANLKLQTRLYVWGGFMLLISVVVGGWLMWREAAHEIRAARERSEFAAAVSHDLRTPLSSMRMLAESLHLGRIDDEVKKRRFLETILKESDRLSRLTDRALYFIQFGQGALRYRMTEGDLGGLVKDVVETFATGLGGEVRERKQTPDGGLQTSDRRSPTADWGSHTSEVKTEGVDPAKWVLELAVSDDLPAVSFDTGAMEQVVFNLLDNAAKYSVDDRRIEIDVGEDEARRHVTITVRDHGMGIASRDMKRIFKAYQRGGGTGHTSGLGLGLALCRDIVRAHRGRIDVRSEVGKGSLFTVILPAV